MNMSFQQRTQQLKEAIPLVMQDTAAVLGEDFPPFVERELGQSTIAAALNAEFRNVASGGATLRPIPTGITGEFGNARFNGKPENSNAAQGAKHPFFWKQYAKTKQSAYSIMALSGKKEGVKVLPKQVYQEAAQLEFNNKILQHITDAITRRVQQIFERK